MLAYFLEGRALPAAMLCRLEDRMKYARIAAYLVLATGLAGCGGDRVDGSAALEAMIAEEIDFGQRSVADGTRTAFLAYLAENSIVFQPEPADGRAAQEGTPDNGTLSWEPAYAEIAADGNLGYTTGPWTFEAGEGTDRILIHGHYISIWQVQSDGAWKVILDIGNTYPDPFPTGNPVEKRQAGERVDDADPDAGREQLLALDRSLSSGPDRIDSLLALADPDIRMYRNGERPARGREAALDLLGLTLSGAEEPEGSARWDPLDAGVAGSGDLGYSYGYAGVSEDSTSYLRIWRRRPGGDWKIILDVVI
jgi:ketosteroid isomerase-like protein